MIKVFVVQASRSEFRFPELTLMLGGLDAMLVGPALKTWDKAPQSKLSSEMAVSESSWFNWVYLNK